MGYFSTASAFMPHYDNAWNGWTARPSGETWVENYHGQPTARDSGWYKCPFCGRRQNIKDDGGNCLSCGGDVTHEHVR